MPVTYHIDAAKKLIHTTCTSPLRFPEVIEHFRTLRKDPACVGYLDILLDVSDVDTLPESRQLGSVGMELSATRAQVQFGLLAIVATRDAMFGMMRVFEVLATPYVRAVKVFRGAAEAQAWLVSQQTAKDA